jgi:copper chaperone CopZ
MSEHEKCHVEPLRKPLDRKALASAEVAFLTVAGMGCPNCAMRVRNALLRLKGVLYVDVSLARGMAAVAFRPEQMTTEDLMTAVARAGSETRHHYLARLLQTMPAREAFTFATETA